MTLTSHGHHITGTTTGDESKNTPKAKCGGTDTCSQCRMETVRYQVFAAENAR